MDMDLNMDHMDRLARAPNQSILNQTTRHCLLWCSYEADGSAKALKINYQSAIAH